MHTTAVVAESEVQLKTFFPSFRALEQKKRAMELAEEERRQRALEERRQTQREATERCKMAISRLRISSRTSNPRHRDVPVESESHYIYPITLEL